MAAVARCNRALKVPIGISRTKAASASDMPEVVMDDENGALLRRQATEAALQLVTQGGRLLGVAMPTPFGRGHVDLDHVASLGPPQPPR